MIEGGNAGNDEDAFGLHLRYKKKSSLPYFWLQKSFLSYRKASKAEAVDCLTTNLSLSTPVLLEDFLGHIISIQNSWSCHLIPIFVVS